MTDDFHDRRAYDFGAGVPAALAELASIAAEFPPMDIAGSRMGHRVMARLAGPVPELYEVRNVTIPLRRHGGGLGLRVHRPAPGRLPVALFLHGGWFFAGDLESHDTFARLLADAAECVVVAVHYRRPPEWPCPDAPDDCLLAARWVVEHADELGIDARALAIVGDGAGGTLAAVTARRARDAGGPEFCLQVLLCPLISTGQDSASWRELAGAPIVHPELVRWAWSMYTPPGCEAAPEDIAPGACEDLAGLPPALVLTAEFDPLRAEGEAYAEALQRAGVPVVLHRYPGMIHGFVGLAGVIEAGRDAIEEIAGTLRAAFIAA
ncbi:MAG TPA: alpha/beta hydrolase [Sporichthya sp.]|nr:alpha/beta hydrolase [Sporichthya sp.]